MLAASLWEHPGFLLLIAFIALVRWLVSKAKSQVQDGQSPMENPPARPITRGGETQSEEERIRRFLEALGQPAGTTPPPQVPRRPRSVTPNIFSPLPPLKTAPPPLPAEEPRAFVAPPPLPAETTPTRLDTDFQVQDFTPQPSSEPRTERPASGDGTRIKLGTPQDLRTAIILREIFGPPRSLQPLDLTTSS